MGGAGATVTADGRTLPQLLKNAGYAPAELEALKSPGARKLALLDKRIDGRYFGKVVRKLGRR